jgi:electron transport complex protein RnfB
MRWAAPLHEHLAPTTDGTGKAVIPERIDAALPQTQCTRCGYPDCRAYAEAIATVAAPINRCPPGGAEGIVRLAAITGGELTALDPTCGAEGPRKTVFIDESWCIGCTLCIEACPVDCIIGAPRRMHTVIEADCTGCELCLPACPVDCIVVEDATPGRTGWQAWSAEQANDARARYLARNARREHAMRENDERLAKEAKHKLADLPAASHIADVQTLDAKRATIEAALARARAKNGTPA